MMIRQYSGPHAKFSTKLRKRWGKDELAIDSTSFYKTSDNVIIGQGSYRARLLSLGYGDPFCICQSTRRSYPAIYEVTDKNEERVWKSVTFYGGKWDVIDTPRIVKIKLRAQYKKIVDMNKDLKKEIEKEHESEG